MTDYLFLFSNAPAPGLFDKVRVALAGGRRPLAVCLQRSDQMLAVDPPAGCRFIPYHAPFRGVGLRRVAVLLAFARWLRGIMRTDLVAGGDCYCDSLDLLAVAMVAGARRRLRHRLEVRDLHELQLRGGPAAAAVRAVEGRLLPRLHTLILTSDEYWRRYYHAYRIKRRVTVENVPQRAAWEGFRRRPADGGFRIGFVGVIRYRECLESLVVAVRRLRAEGFPVTVRFAGGGETAALQSFCGGDDFVEFTGPFAYTAAVQELYADLDLIYSVYDTRLENVRLAMPNKFYEALIARIPIMVAAGTYLESRVRQAGIGVGVPGRDPGQIAAALRPALGRAGWYAEAEANLRAGAPEALFAEHERSIRQAVLGDPAAAAGAD